MYFIFKELYFAYLLIVIHVDFELITLSIGIKWLFFLLYVVRALTAVKVDIVEGGIVASDTLVGLNFGFDSADSSSARSAPLTESTSLRPVSGERVVVATAEHDVVHGRFVAQLSWRLNAQTERGQVAVIGAHELP